MRWLEAPLAEPSQAESSLASGESRQKISPHNSQHQLKWRSSEVAESTQRVINFRKNMFVLSSFLMHTPTTHSKARLAWPFSGRGLSAFCFRKATMSWCLSSFARTHPYTESATNGPGEGCQGCLKEWAARTGFSSAGWWQPAPALRGQVCLKSCADWQPARMRAASPHGLEAAGLLYGRAFWAFNRLLSFGRVYKFTKKCILTHCQVMHP